MREKLTEVAAPAAPLLEKARATMRGRAEIEAALSRHRPRR